MQSCEELPRFLIGWILAQAESGSRHLEESSQQVPELLTGVAAVPASVELTCVWHSPQPRVSCGPGQDLYLLSPCCT